MKNLKYLYLVLFSGLVVWSCEQDLTTIEPNPNFTPVSVGGPLSAGSADFTKFVAVGNSLTAGFQAAALFDEGQANSLPLILSQQFAQVGGGDFVQPLINSVNGYNSTFSNPPDLILGRLLLAGSPPAPTPTLSDASALPSPLNPNFVYSGNPINNFGVPGILLGQALIPETGNWSLFGADPRFNPYYARFASNPGTSTIIGDAIAAQGTFFMFWLGNNDILGYATTGGSGAVPLTDPATFATLYGAALSGLTTDPNIKGVVANIASVTSIPFFRLVPWNAIPFVEGDPTIAVANGAYAAYNGGLDQLVGVFPGFTQTEADLRKISFAAGANGIVIDDESLTDLTSFNLPTIRQANGNDLITLSAGAILGERADENDPLSIIGVVVPLADQYVLIPDELTEINDATTAYNTSIPDVISALGLSDRIAVADVSQALADLTGQGAALADGLVVTTSLVPPTGLFSEDGVHPNSRGYAFTSNVFIDAINAKFGANVPKVNVASFAATAAPLP